MVDIVKEAINSMKPKEEEKEIDYNSLGIQQKEEKEEKQKPLDKMSQRELHRLMDKALEEDDFATLREIQKHLKD